MIKVKRTARTVKLSYIAKALFINFLALVIIMLLFEPTGKSDDYDMANVLYGGVSGDYSPFILYVNVLLGYVLKFMVSLFPKISWFYILQYISIFISFCTITWIFLKKNETFRFIVLYFTMMMFAAYEFYIRITFSKTAGILIIAGLLFTLYTIEEKLKLYKVIWGIALAFLGMLWRSAMLNLLIAIFFSVFITMIIHTWGNWDKIFWRKVFIFAFVTIILFVSNLVTDSYNDKAFNDDKEWRAYIQDNIARSSVDDYGWPDYVTYEVEYNKIGISYNDYIMWSQYANISDPDLLNEQTFEKIRNIEIVTEHRSIVEILQDANRNLLSYLTRNTMFYLFLTSSILLLLIGEKKNKIVFFNVSGCWLFAYYYMYYRGRIQNHVDACVAFAGAVILLYYSSSKNKLQKEIVYKVGLSISLVFIIAANHFYADLTTSTYLGAYYGNYESEKERYYENYQKLSLLSDDREALYLLNSYEMLTIYQCFPVFQIIDKGFYHNIFKLNQFIVPSFKQALTNYGVENPFKELVNNNIYFCSSKEDKEQLDVILEYVREHYNKNAYYNLAKNVEGMYIYKFNEGDLQFDTQEIREGPFDKEFNYNIDENNRLSIEGHAYMDETDSYAQNMYLEIYDKNKDKFSYQYVTQYEYSKAEKKDKYHGRYSGFKIDIPIALSQKSDLALIVENEKGTFRIPIILDRSKL